MYNKIIHYLNNLEEFDMKKPSRTLSISLILVLTLSILSATVAFAAPPLAIHIEVDEFINQNGEVFNASGPAVKAGVVCPTGTVDDIYSNPFGPPVGNYTYLSIKKKFTCNDGSGDFFYIKMKVKLNNTTNVTTAKWHFTNGEGDYLPLHGHGTLVGTPVTPGISINDVYDGKVK
jgi:hypothetical protein